MAASAADALALIAGQSFDLVVTDVKMEDSEAGLRVLQQAKAKNSGTQVIVMTSYGCIDVAMKAILLGAFDFVPRGTPGLNSYAMLANKVPLALAVASELRNSEKTPGP